VAIARLVDEVLAAPTVTIARQHGVADRLARTDGAYATFMGLLRDRLGSAVRDAARGQPGPLMRRRPLGEWGEVWHALGRLHGETERANLDKRHAIVAGLDLL